MSFVVELWEFMRERKKFWLLPIVTMTLVFGGLVVLSQGYWQRAYGGRGPEGVQRFRDVPGGRDDHLRAVRLRSGGRRLPNELRDRHRLRGQALRRWPLPHQPRARPLHADRPVRVGILRRRLLLRRRLQRQLRVLRRRGPRGHLLAAPGSRSGR